MIEIEISISELLILREPFIDQCKSEVMRFSGLILESDEIRRGRGVVEEYCTGKYSSVDRSCIDADIRTMIFREILLPPYHIALPLMLYLRPSIHIDEVLKRSIRIYRDHS
jgi:hypothetical protein